MQKTLLTYVKPHVQEDPLSMILGIGYLGAQMEREGLPIALHDERIGTDQEMKAAIDARLLGRPCMSASAIELLRARGSIAGTCADEALAHDMRISTRAGALARLGRCLWDMRASNLSM